MLVVCVGVAMPPVWRVTRRYFCDAARAAVVGPPRTVGGCIYIYIYWCYMVYDEFSSVGCMYTGMCARGRMHVAIIKIRWRPRTGASFGSFKSPVP